ncbi:hypothetical protein B0H12DRAFT_1114009 [Mycena haematopus]|nr:hypothetical protein B0H12DRAFT_1114009 [Mycena haematopus]
MTSTCLTIDHSLAPICCSSNLRIYHCNRNLLFHPAPLRTRASHEPSDTSKRQLIVPEHILITVLTIIANTRRRQLDLALLLHILAQALCILVRTSIHTIQHLSISTTKANVGYISTHIYRIKFTI